MEKWINKIHLGNTLEVLKQIPDNYVDTIITSPPYFGLRDYNVKGQIGLENTLNEYIDKLLSVTKELKRVLKLTGVLYWNHGDSYWGSGKGMDIKYGKGRDNNPSFTKGSGYQAKCMLLQNYRLIINMIDEQNWILRNDIKWWKPNHMPSSVTDRLTNAYEPVFMLVKNKKYWYDLDVIRIPHTVCGVTDKRPMGILRQKLYSNSAYNKSNDLHLAQFKTKIPQDYAESFGSPRARNYRKNIDLRDDDKGGKNPGDVWKISTQSFSESHFATFPEALLIPMIKSSCPAWICKKCGKTRVRIIDKGKLSGRTENDGKGYILPKSKQAKQDDKKVKAGNWIPNMKYENKTIGWTDCKCGKGFNPGIVLDPFMGAGTTAVAAKKLGRNYIGIELNPDYIKMANKRIKNTIQGNELDKYVGKNNG